MSEEKVQVEETKEETQQIEETKQVEKQENIGIADLINWSDEQCEEFDKSKHFSAINVREIARSLVSSIQKYNELLVTSEQFKQFVISGKMIGYTITCPKCKINYSVNAPDLKFDEEITCQDCGEKYIQNKNITGLYVRGDENAAQE